MRTSSTITRFEHQKLFIDEEGFEMRHWKLLARYNEKYRNKFFELLHNGIRFKEHVGVIQVNNLTIEILPKIDNETEDENQWQAILLDMLQECRWMRIHAPEKAFLRIKPRSILDAYLIIFMDACEHLLRIGLVKKYRRQEDNLNVMKGKLVFSKHIQKNVIHRERFYTLHSVYDKNNIFNQLLFKTLKTIAILNVSSSIRDNLSRLLFEFPEMEDIRVTTQTFQNLAYDHKTRHYQDAMDIAAMILLHYMPDIRGGRDHVFSLLFNMNQLWEEYFFRRLRKSLPEKWAISAKRRKLFWKGMGRPEHLIPDILLTTPNKMEIILDTKWKLPDGNKPSSADLKQIFTYNEYWDSNLGILLYPKDKKGPKLIWEPGKYHNRFSDCAVSKLSVLDDSGNLDKNFTAPLINKLIDEVKSVV